MAANVTFVIGRAGAGKSRYLRHRIAKLRDAGVSCALIVPEQFTFEAERELAQKLPGGLLRVDVYSFTSLAQRLLEDAGERTAFLCAQGRRMIARRAADLCKNELLSFGGVCGKAGFCAQCDAMFSLYKRCDLSPADVKTAAKKLGDAPLGRKLHDLALLYEKSEELLAGAYIHPEDALGASAGYIAGSFIEGQAVLVDNCDFWAAQINGMLEACMDCAGSLIFCIRADRSADCRDRRVFANEQRAYERLLAMARAHGCPIDTVTLPEEDAPWGGTRYKSAALAHMEREIFAEPFTPFAGDAAAITLFAAADIGYECAAAADAVQRAAAMGYRYREMAVVACDLPAYAESMQRALRQRNIPYFTDVSHPLAGYGLSRLLTAALRCAVNGYAARDMLSLCKTLLAGVAREDAEIFENYVLRYGVRGRAFLKAFARGDAPAQAEAARAMLAEPLQALQAALKAAATVGEKAEVLYAYMETLGVRESIEALCETLLNEGRLALRDENRQVYGLMMELFSQLHAIMGDTPVTDKEFLSLFEEGIAAYEAGVIPATADQLLFGSVDRTRARSVKVMLLIGAREGALPKSTPDEGLIDDEELARLSEAGLRVWDDSAVHAAGARMDAYLALTKPSDRLYVSYCAAGEAVPSPLFDRLRALFPGLRVHTALNDSAPTDAEGGFLRLAASLRDFADEGAPPDQALYACFAADTHYAKRLAALEEALYHENARASISASLAETLYGRSGSASRLEAYNECPFKHYARYGLKAQTRKEYGEQHADRGSFCHEALSCYMETLAKENRDVKSMTQADVNAVLDAIFPSLRETHNDGALRDTARSRALARRLEQRVRTTAWALTQQLAAGSFRLIGTELSFGRGGVMPPITMQLMDGVYTLSGRIDRLDGYEENGVRYARIIDYKTGTPAFSYTDIYHGLKLQLPLYLAAASAVYDAVAAGMYYMPVKDPAADEGEAPEKAILKELSMKGITLGDPVVDKATDAAALGVVEKKGAPVGQDVMRRVLQTADAVGCETAARILSGAAAASPVRRGKETPCAYCDYKSLCGFDRKLSGSRSRNVEEMNEESFMEHTHA